MKEAGRILVEEFQINELKIDFMGYEIESLNQLTFHHLIIPSRLHGPYESWNGAILRGDTSHQYLHIIEALDFEIFLAITSEIIDEKIKGYLNRDNLLRIRALLNQFEQKYIYGHKCKYKIKEEYLFRQELILSRKKI